MVKKAFTLETIMKLHNFPFKVQKPSWTSDFYFRAEYMDKNGWIRGTAFKGGEKHLTKEYKYRPQEIMYIYGESMNIQQPEPSNGIWRVTPVEKTPGARNDEPVLSSDTKTCNTCMLMKRGDCFGKNDICEDYKHSPSVSEREKKTWPTYGDATAFRLGKRRR